MVIKSHASDAWLLNLHSVPLTWEESKSSGPSISMSTFKSYTLKPADLLTLNNAMVVFRHFCITLVE